jgi:hypothetical protein
MLLSDGENDCEEFGEKIKFGYENKGKQSN